MSKKKTPTSFSLSEKHKALLKAVADTERRTLTQVLEILIEEKAAALKIKVK